jgi:pilus assembly protein CpaD
MERPMPTPKDIMRFASLAALLIAGSCAPPINDGTGFVSDPQANHPIAVEPDYHTIRLPYSASDAGLMPDDSARFSLFVADYMSGGNGAISISAPSGPSANAAIGYFGERLAQFGVPRDRILVGMRNESGDGKIEIGYVAYKAHVENCTQGGDWSKDWQDTADNQPPPNFGCSVQHNIAAQVSDPRDLVQPRPMDASDATRRNTVMGHYEKGEITQADKHTADKPVEQSGQSSEIQ